MKKLDKIINDIRENKVKCYFISPHLDDAAFSAGGLISHLAPLTDVTVINIFTSHGKTKHSLSAKSFIKQSGYKINNIDKFYKERMSEDKKVFKDIKVKVINLGIKDALWRKNPNLNMLQKSLSKYINEFSYIYPTHKLHISKGKVNKADARTINKISKKLNMLINKNKPYYVFCPIGVGNHVDHAITRKIIKDNFKNIVYWEDFPYNKKFETSNIFVKENKLVPNIFNKNQKTRKQMCLSYFSQVKLVFPQSEVGLKQEKYFIKS